MIFALENHRLCLCFYQARACDSILYFLLFSSFSATATLNHQQTLCQWEGDVEGRFHQQCLKQNWGGVAWQRSDPWVLPLQEVSRNKIKCFCRCCRFNILNYSFTHTFIYPFVSDSPRAAEVQSPKPSLALSDPFLGTPITMTSKRKSR